MNSSTLADKRAEVAVSGAPHARSARDQPAMILALCLLAFCEPCYAYIDPNAGGWLFQMLFPLLATIVGLWAILKRMIKDFFRRIFGRNRADK